jgi:hypothetical protein
LDQAPSFAKALIRQYVVPSRGVWSQHGARKLGQRATSFRAVTCDSFRKSEESYS